MNDYAIPTSSVNNREEGLRRDGRKLRRTKPFADTMARMVDAAEAEGLAVPAGNAAPAAPAAVAPGRDEVGLRHGRGPLHHTAGLEATLDGFSSAAAAEPSGGLPIAIELGSKLRAARLAASLTQAALASRTGILQSTISEIEKGKGSSGPNCGTVQKIAAALGLRIELVPIALPDAAD